MMEKFFEDFHEGQKERFGQYEVSESEVLDFASKYDPQPFHLDKQAAEKSIFGGLCASGWHICAMTMRMMVDHMREQKVMSMGSPGVDEIRWLKPVFPGDTLNVEMTVAAKRRLKSRPNMGNVICHYTVSNQDDQPVMTFKGSAFFATRSQTETA